MLRESRKLLPLVAVALFLMATPSFAAGCTWEACWHCAPDYWGETYCDALTTGNGYLCCEEYSLPSGAIQCRTYDYLCAGAVIWDVY